MSEKTLSVTSQADASKKIPDFKFVGNGDAWQLLGKASSEDQGWMKSSKAYHIPGVGCVIQVTTKERTGVAEALVLVPGTHIVDDVNGGRKVVKA